MRRAGTCLLLGLAACSRPSTIQVALPPPAEGALSVVLVFESATSSLEVHAFDLGALDKLHPPFLTDYDGEIVDLTVLEYQRPLARLGLDAGRIEEAPPSGVTLPNRDVARAQHRRVSDEDQGGWDPIAPADLAPRLAHVKVRGRTPGCTELEKVREITFDEAMGTSAFPVLKLSDDTALVGAIGSHPQTRVPYPSGLFIVRLGEGDAVEVTNITSTFGPLNISGGHRTDDGTLWLGGRGPAGAHLVRARFDGGTLTATVVATSSAGDDFRWLVGPRDDASTELWGLTSNGQLARFDGSRWRPIYKFPDVMRHNHRGGLVWLGPGRVAAAKPVEPHIVFVEGEDVSFEPWRADQGRPPAHSLHRLADGTLLAGTDEARVFVNRGQGWQDLGKIAPDLGYPVVGFGPIDGGWLAGGWSGFIVQYSDEARAFCPSMLVSSSDNYHLVRVGDRWLAGGVTPGTVPSARLSLLRRVF